ncbi:hypothetical protein Pmani_014219 [Petrolisthes manimaculis]|uniref:Iron-binding zinc finger CDGSH type domain-containing protein n=1 Tax=Petrolisthes manimaculis TaxID=1843537 RepID=A0AAE1PUF3_9EUCA|nr:hypothetical protein Pmani_014219 [Petrolisthes manimaculis]
MTVLKHLVRLPFVWLARPFAQNTARFSTQDPTLSKTEEDTAELKLKGRIYSKKPMKVELVGGKRYLWCACGYSKKQPFCDGTHLWSRFKLNIKQHPVFFKAPKDMKASMCLCKQTKNPPYCDGTHRRTEVQQVDGE